LFARANSVNNQWFTDSIRVQNRHFQTRIREDGLSAFDENSVDAYPATLAAAVAASIAARRSLTSTSGATHEAMEVLK